MDSLIFLAKLCPSLPIPLWNKPKQIILEPGECLSSYDVSALFTSVPIDPALTIIMIYWKRTTFSRKELLWKLVTLSSYWSFVSRTPTFLSQDQFYEQVEGAAMVPQSALL